MTAKTKKGKGTTAAQEVASAVTPAAESAPVKEPTKSDSKEKKGTEKKGNTVLEGVGLSALKRHGLSEVFVTTDGQAFPLQSDAQNHARNLGNKDILKVTNE